MSDVNPALPDVPQGCTGEILAANASWAQKLNQTFPQYFPDNTQRQAPKILWIGCSDSRVHESDAMAALPGTAFVHRNVANQFHIDDDSALSVVSYAMKLGIQDIVIVGHDHCGTVALAMRESRRAPSVKSVSVNSTTSSQIKHQPTILDGIQERYHHVVDILLHHHHHHHPAPVEAQIQDPKSKNPDEAIMNWIEPLTDRLRKVVLPEDNYQALKIAIEENVKMQVENLAQLEEFIKTSARNKPVQVHGWVYDPSTGFLRDLQVTKVIGEEIRK